MKGSQLSRGLSHLRHTPALLARTVGCLGIGETFSLEVVNKGHKFSSIQGARLTWLMCGPAGSWCLSQLVLGRPFLSRSLISSIQQVHKQ